MRKRTLGELLTLIFLAIMVAVPSANANSEGSWEGTVRDEAGGPVEEATLKLRSASGTDVYTTKSAAGGKFVFSEIPAGSYELLVEKDQKVWKLTDRVVFKKGTILAESLQLPLQKQEILIIPSTDVTSQQASGGEHLSGGKVSSLPLNARDFSKLLLLAAGTMTDTNGAANFTQQYSVNGQRGTATVFAMDGADTTDPELGGATFSNFNVDAIQEVQASAGVMPAEIGHGAASYSNVVTKSGTNELHGTAFEFLRNAALDARNFFDYSNPEDPRRIPPFIRNEFGFTLGGPVVLPKLYNGRNRTYFFGEYQGFRQVLGTTQVFAVPTAAEREGIDTTTYPGDTLTVPVNAEIAQLINRYPLPNLPQGAFGDRTFAGSSKVTTNTNQFSVRVDHRISDKAELLTRFSLNNVTGPVTNPDQTVIDPSFGVQFFDHQRNIAARYTRTVTQNLSFDLGFGYVRSTPFFPAGNHSDPALAFADGLYQTFNSAGGSITGSYSNLYQIRANANYVHGKHAFRFGYESRANKDATIFGINPNGLYSFGGGKAYAPVAITSASGTHNINVGDPLPDSLTGLLTASPYAYSVMAAASVTPMGDKFDEAAVRREAYNFYFQDSWKATQRLTVNYGLRYEVNSRIHESHHRTSSAQFIGPDGKPAPYWDHSASQVFVYNPQPPYNQDWSGWGPRVTLDYALTSKTVLHAGGAITTILPNLWQDNFLTGGVPLATTLYSTALQGIPLPFSSTIVPVNLPTPYATDGQVLFPNGDASNVAPNTQVDLVRYQNDLTALAPGNQVQLLSVAGIARNFKNGYIGSWTAGIDHDIRDFHLSVAYVATAGIHLAAGYSPNSYGGAEPAFAPFTQFDEQGRAIGGLGPESIMTTSAHSSYNSLQASVTKNSPRAGLGLQASYTYGKSLDDTSTVLGGSFGASGVVLQTAPQNPWNLSVEKGVSTFDVKHVFALSVIQLLPLERVGFFEPLSKTITAGWQFLNITTVTSGSPFTVYSGIQQTGAGSGGADRPNLAEMPSFSTSRTVREDYFGRGKNNNTFFNIPINIPGGTGPYSGEFGALGRNVFRGPGYLNFDIALIKDTPFGHRAGGELGTMEFRAEFFNIFNKVNFGLPSNVVQGSGFGIISKTAGTSRQIQFSLKLIF
jgi:hypothetical protein